MSLGASRLKKRILALVVGLLATLNFSACGSSHSTQTKSGLKERVLASQGVTATFAFGGLVMIDGENDTLARIAPLNGGNSPGLMVLSPTRNIVASFDASSNSVVAVSTTSETTIGSARLLGPTTSFVIPTASALGYAAVPTATVNGFAFLGAVQTMNLSTGAVSTIAVSNAQTVVSNDTGTQLLVFSNDSDDLTILFPGVAVPPVDLSCLSNPGNSVCTVLQDARLSRPVNAIVSGSTAYILNCGLKCGGTQQASVAVFDLNSLSITQTIPVDAATMALLNGSTLYVAGTPPSNNDCEGQTTQATTCGRLDIVDLGSATVTGTAVITDGYHQRMDLTSNGQLFIGARGCTNIGNISNPIGEVRGCLSIYHVGDGSVVIPADNGDVNGLQGFTTRNVEYVAEGGALRVYNLANDELLINDFVPQGSINIVGYVGDVKAIDFF